MRPAKITTICATVGFAAALSPSLSQAADMTSLAPAPVRTPSGWTYTVTLYVWTPDISGNVGVSGLLETPVNADFGDVWNNLDFAAIVTSEARYDRYGILGDAVYLQLSNDSATPRGIVANNVEGMSTS